MGRDRNLADLDLDLDPVARVSTVPNSTAADPRGKVGRGRTDRPATGRRFHGSGATANQEPTGDPHTIGARRDPGRSARRVGRGRNDRETIARGGIGHVTTVPGRNGRGTTARGVTDHPVRARPMTGGRIAVPDAAPHALSAHHPCRHPRSSGRTRS
jgi:hypothetical protein